MSEVIKLTPEEHDQVTQLIKSYGWRILVEKLLIPELLQVSRHVDNVANVEHETQFYRGAKLTMTHLLQTIYRWGRLPNPFEMHYKGLLAAVRVYTEDFSEDIKSQGPTTGPIYQGPTARDSLIPQRKVTKPV